MKAIHLFSFIVSKGVWTAYSTYVYRFSKVFIKLLTQQNKGYFIVFENFKIIWPKGYPYIIDVSFFEIYLVTFYYIWYNI